MSSLGVLDLDPKEGPRAAGGGGSLPAPRAPVGLVQTARSRLSYRRRGLGVLSGDHSDQGSPGGLSARRRVLEGQVGRLGRGHEAVTHAGRPLRRRLPLHLPALPQQRVLPGHHSRLHLHLRAGL